MKISIRQESECDYLDVFNLINKAFESEENSNPDEPCLVERLRKSDAFIPELSLVAEIDNNIIGHILLTKIKIKNKENEFNSLALAPVSVFPKYQGKGIGGLLIKQAHKKAKEFGFKSVIILGHETYYPRFGYQLTEKYGIQLPFEVPKENCMAVELVEGGLNNVCGLVEYPKEFFERRTA